MQNKIYPCLWYNQNAKEAAELYCSVFANSKITSHNSFVYNLNLAGHQFMLMNGGPGYIPNPSMSFFVSFDDEDLLNETWEKISEGGQVMMNIDKYDWSERYGWCADRFGISWQLMMGKISDMGQVISPALMYTQDAFGQAEEAFTFYSRIFSDSAMISTRHFPEADALHAGILMFGQFI